jgi:hypothetical protein
VRPNRWRSASVWPGWRYPAALSSTVQKATSSDAENLRGAELTVQERAEHIAEWVRRLRRTSAMRCKLRRINYAKPANNPEA